jgi:hypothetical protein
MPLPEFKTMVREQYNMLLIDRDAALAAIPAMLPSDAETRRSALDLIRRVLGARGELSAEDQARLEEVTRLFAGAMPVVAAPALSVVESAPEHAKAS